MKYLIILLVFTLSNFIFAEKPQGDATKIKISVMDLKAENGIDKGVVTLLYELILTEFQNYSNLSVISKTDISSMVQYETEKELAGCDDTSCMAEIGGALGVDKVVLGHVGKLGSSYVVTLKLMNIKNATVENRVSETIPANEDKLIPLIKFLANKLLKKYSKFNTKLENNDTFTKKEALDNSEAKSGSKLFTWISLGTGTALLTGGIVYHFLYVSSYEDDFNSGKLKEGNLSDEKLDYYNDTYTSRQIIRNTLLISGGALIVTGSILYFFEGEPDKSSKNLTISPFITNDSFYVTTSFSF